MNAGAQSSADRYFEWSTKLARILGWPSLERYHHTLSSEKADVEWFETVSNGAILQINTLPSVTLFVFDEVSEIHSPYIFMDFTRVENLPVEIVASAISGLLHSQWFLSRGPRKAYTKMNPTALGWASSQLRLRSPYRIDLTDSVISTIRAYTTGKNHT